MIGGPSAIAAALALLAVLLMMAIEALISRRHEDRLRARGAVEPDDPAYALMLWAYPGAFIVMAAEGAMRPSWPAVTLAGLGLFVVSKALKVWAMTSLGERWTFRVLVLPGVPLVTIGPYRFVRHPNYVAVAGELVGMALLVGASISGPVVTLLFGLLLRRRILTENSALQQAKRS